MAPPLAGAHREDAIGFVVDLGVFKVFQDVFRIGYCHHGSSWSLSSRPRLLRRARRLRLSTSFARYTSSTLTPSALAMSDALQSPSTRFCNTRGASG